MSQDKLIELYQRASKHSHYQLLARSVRSIIDQTSLKVSSRFEEERLGYIASRCRFDAQIVSDVGGNTGFFSFESAALGAARVLYFDGNRAHAEFVAEASHVLGVGDVITVSDHYLNFRNDFPGQVDLCFLLNVLHHVGDDFGDATMTVDEARSQILTSLAYLSRFAKVLVFQLGYNWKGDRNRPLFPGGTKAEQIDFVRRGTADDWHVAHIGIAARVDGKVVYQDLSEENIERDDRLGEFLNRPLFILESRHA